MQSQAGSFIKGLGTGMVAGAAALVVGKVVMQDHKNITKGSAKLVKAVGDFVDGVQTGRYTENRYVSACFQGCLL